MVVPTTIPYVDSSLSNPGSNRWPVSRCSAQLSLSWGRGRIIPTVRCVLVTPEQHAVQRLSSLSPAAGTHWTWSSAGFVKQRDAFVARTKALAVALADTHKAWSTQSLQTLQRVGSMIRSTSLDCMAALGKKSTTGQLDTAQQHGSGGGNNGNEDDDTAAGQLRMSLSRFLTTASEAEVAQAAMLADLSDLAYDVANISQQHLLEAHGLSMVANSRSSSTAQQSEQPLLSPAQPQHALEQQQLAIASPPMLQAPWPFAGLQHSGSSLQLASSGSLPASPRAPMVMSSFSEGDMCAELQMATAAAPVTDMGSPRRMSSAAAGGAGSSSGLPAATAADAPPMLLRQRSCDLYMDMSLEQQDSSSSEVALLQQLKQQEALLLLEMQANQQVLLLLQQQQEVDAACNSPQHTVHPSPAAIAAATSSISVAAAAAAASSGRTEPQYESSMLAGIAAVAEASSTSSSSTPADWFCCDGPCSNMDPTPTRFFVIQGSITLEHWRINLTIDPCEFEGGALGAIKVHRGVYEAALAMYDALLPLVEEQLAQHPDGKVSFTGHSLGGSLATLLMLLFVHRGVLPAANLATVRTFGSPAVFCEGATGSPPACGACQACSLACEHRNSHGAGSSSHASSSPDGLLARLGLPMESVVNVIMTRDIVPRAFVCDYTPVADVLKSWLPSFKELNGLAACKQHKALYNFIGTVEVLQPSLDCDFVLPDEHHAMLPPQAALYKLTEPSSPVNPSLQALAGTKKQLKKGSFGNLSSLASIGSLSLSSALAELTSNFSLTSSNRGNTSNSMVTVPVTAEELSASTSDSSSMAGAEEPLAVVEQAEFGQLAGEVPNLTVGDAILTFMNSPHPLQTLGEMRAYGPNGSISRFHNPTSYTKALQMLPRV